MLMWRTVVFLGPHVTAGVPKLTCNTVDTLWCGAQARAPHSYTSHNPAPAAKELPPASFLGGRAETRVRS